MPYTTFSSLFAYEVKFASSFLLSKAFDYINHELLVRKLNNNGIKGNVLEWITSFLTGRTAQVKIKNFNSQPFNIQSGVPQGSHLYTLPYPELCRTKLFSLRT